MSTHEAGTRPWKQQLASGHRPVQDALTVEHERSTVMRAWEASIVVGLLQTADYARHVFNAFVDLRETVRDVDDAVQARMQRQELLDRPDKQYHVLMSESVLRAQLCPPGVMAAQLDRLSDATALDTFSLSIIPFEASLALPPANGFWMHDERLVIVEDWHAELWLDQPDDIALYRRVWDTLSGSAVFGEDARKVITRCRKALGSV
ncbi:DUF5753 domain-containing protein [Kitasatospora sp. NPDC093550]|uniref:DUF5753 domain-containing protein n=1 Tax=Kitasatospora sp. NPDC093550 TaxID=3364089 RepID=UPI00381374C1